MVRSTRFRLIALVLVLLAASPFTAPFSAHNACDAQYKDASSADKAVSDVALAPWPVTAVPFEMAWRLGADRPVRGAGRRQVVSTVLRV